MGWEVEYTDEFGDWYDSLTEDEQESVRASIGLLEARGPDLPRPHADTIKGSRHSNMRELRVQHQGRPYRVFYAFDPRRVAILLIGGDKTGDKQFYRTFIPMADDLFDQHLRTIEEEKDSS